MLQRAREAFAQIEGRAAPFYGLAAALGMAAPLLAGALTGHAAQGSLAALGAFLVAVTSPEGPYGARARSLMITVTVVAAGATIGGYLNSHEWAPLVVIPLVVVLGAAVPWIGPTAALAVLLTSMRPPSPGVLYDGFLELLGGVLVTLLFLAPWPAFRLRPLRTVLTEAAEAVGGALEALAADAVPSDAVAGHSDWIARRRAALRALNAARTTYGLYRADRGGPHKPERVILALGRIMQETVTLRALVDAARDRPLEPEREPDLSIAITTLATRLRLLAGVIAATGDGPAGDEDSTAIGRLARQSEKVRGAGLAGDDDLVAAALIDQVWLSVDRIAEDLAYADRLVRGGLRLGLVPPRLPRLPHPRTILARWREAVNTRSPGFRQLSRIGVAVTISLALASAMRLPHGHWLTLTVMMSLRNTYGQTATRTMQMVGGTAIGAVIATAVLVLTPSQVAVALVLFFFGLAGFTLRSVNYTYWALFGATPIALILLDFATPAGWTAAGERIALIGAGCCLALLAARTLWPTADATKLPSQLAGLLNRNARLARATADVVAGEAGQLPRELIAAAEDASRGVRDARNRLSDEPLPSTERIARLGSALVAANRTRDHLVAVARMTRDESVDRSGPLPRILVEVANRLEEAADPRNGGQRPADWLDEEFAELDEYLATLVRRRRAEGGRADEITPLHQTLLQAAGARYALRSLRSDADDLCQSALAAQLSLEDSPDDLAFAGEAAGSPAPAVAVGIDDAQATAGLRGVVDSFEYGWLVAGVRDETHHAVQLADQAHQDHPVLSGTQWRPIAERVGDKFRDDHDNVIMELVEVPAVEHLGSEGACDLDRGRLSGQGEGRVADMSVITGAAVGERAWLLEARHDFRDVQAGFNGRSRCAFHVVPRQRMAANLTQSRHAIACAISSRYRWIGAS